MSNSPAEYQAERVVEGKSSMKTWSFSRSGASTWSTRMCGETKR